MIVKIDIRLDLPTNLRNNNIGSVLHGVLMEWLPVSIVEKLHQPSMYSPLKQRILFENKESVWEIVCLSQELGEIILEVLAKESTITIKRHSVTVSIDSFSVQKYEISEMINKSFSNQKPIQFITIKICSPMSFKSNGRYDIFPDVKKFFRSIMLTFDSFYDEYQLYDRSTLEYLAEQITIVNYQLKSTKYHLEGIQIPSFVGHITFRVNGPLSFHQLIHFLISFGELSGVGIKTSLGMGKYRIIK
ncbi:CRISPR-associated endoribonuclease Cas6 [Enterococcus xiangfangensis]|uniref:CRISPR-associated endoribonuclease Cas6 n=1 Tax=Enterococcus xiangfangensis TaxID=1296537 RepID=A0ABU3FDQ2_9ENTE|nr:CRISPR-associated endoribonuclease Cas6 [Enterococcus xiangfangensis]MDT2760813.1 CRISPR-associated endoribonuclease Cas6 [Enterococcus xiangfangensis]